jgi:hypothetical protein
MSNTTTNTEVSPVKAGYTSKENFESWIASVTRYPLLPAESLQTKEQIESLVIRLALVIRNAKTHLEKHYPGKQYPGWTGCEYAKEWESTLAELKGWLQNAQPILERNRI